MRSKRSSSNNLNIPHKYTSMSRPIKLRCVSNLSDSNQMAAFESTSMINIILHSNSSELLTTDCHSNDLIGLVYELFNNSALRMCASIL